MLDGVLPRYDVREYHETGVAAGPGDALAAALGIPAAGDPIVGVLFRLRGIPGGDLPLRDFIAQLGLTRVAQTERSLTAIWDIAGVRIAFGLWAEPRGDREARLATETRVLALSRGARVRFGLYWLLVGPFSALIRRRWLAAAKRTAERER